MPTRVQSFQDGQRITVNTLIKNPTLVPARVLSMTRMAFLGDAILRRVDAVPSGVVVYNESESLFADQDVEVVEEYGEIPVAMSSVGAKKVAKTVKRGLAVKISREMRDRNQMDRVNLQITRVRNTMVRAWEDVFLSIVLNHPDVNTVAATTAWDSSTSKIRFDLGEAAKTIVKAAADEAGQQRYGFSPNTLIIPEDTEWDWLQSDEVNKVFQQSPLNQQAPQYTGTLPNRFYGFTVMKSWRLPSNKAVLLERGTVGGIADERRLESTPLYAEGGGPNGGPTETWRSDTTRASAVFLDQPKAACIITGV